VEGEYLGEVAKRRWPVLMFIFCFDVVCYLFRSVAKVIATGGAGARHVASLRALRRRKGQPGSRRSFKRHLASRGLPGPTTAAAAAATAAAATRRLPITPTAHPPTKPAPPNPTRPAGEAARPLHWLQAVLEMAPQLANMALLYTIIALLNRRARRSGHNAARQEELLLSACIAMALCNLLGSLGADNASDYVYMGYFLICSSTFLKIRW
jgi:hypothetical protein